MLQYPLQNIANIGRTIYLFNRQRDGKLTILQDKNFFPYLYNEDPKGIFYTIDGKKVSKITCREPSQVKQKRTEQYYEADVLYTKRYIIDKITEILPSPTKYLFIDIEIQTKELPNYTNPDKLITCISVYNSLSKEIKTFYINDCLAGAWTYRENELLRNFVDYVKTEQPDLLLGWNFINFDYPYLAARIKKLWSLELAELISPIGKVRYGRKEDEIPYPQGISVLDYLDLFKKIYNREESNALDNVAHKYLKTPLNKKVDFDIISEDIKEKNIGDVRKMVLLEEKLKIIPFYDEIRRMGCCLWEDTDWWSKVLDVMLLKEAKSKGIILPSKHYGEDVIDEVEFEGAYRHCKTGRYLEKVWKADLSGAYPQAIINFCLDISNLTTNKNELKIDITDRETNEVKYPVYFKQNANALLPTLARKLIIKKDYLKKQLKDLDPESPEAKDLKIKYQAVKSLVNSLFGVTALKVFRLYNTNIASAITSIIRDLVHYVEDKLKDQNIEVIYADTDSIMTITQQDPTELLNCLVKQWAKEKYNKDHIDIEFTSEGYYSKLFILALCHYKGYLNTSSGIEIEEKGIEAKRKDSSKFMKEFQTKLIDKILDNESQEAIIQLIDSQKEAIKTVPLTEIGFPCKINNTKVYKSPPIFVRALEYSKELCGFIKNSGDTFYYLYVEPFGTSIRKARRTVKNKETGHKEDRSSEKEIDKNVLAFSEEEFSHIKNIDWNRMINKTIIDKCEHVFIALNWDLSLIKEIKVRKTKNGIK